MNTSIFLAFALLALFVAPAFSQCPDWSYDNFNWGNLCEDYSQCSGPDKGVEQTPININTARWTETPSFLNKIGVGGGNAQLVTLTNSGKGLVLTVSNATQARPINIGGGRIADGTTWNLETIEFHSPAEHTFNGVAPDLEMQSYYVRPTPGDPRGRNVVAVSTFFTKSTGSGPRDNWSKVIFDLLQKRARLNGEGPRARPIENVGTVGDQVSYIADFEYFINQNNHFKRFYTYDGGISQPPCSQNVEWYLRAVFDQVSQEQLEQISAFGPNARPIQPLGDREPWFYSVATD